MCMALPEADAGLYIAPSLGITFPFNVVPKSQCLPVSQAGWGAL